MQELIAVQIGKFVRNINKKERKRIMQKYGSSNLLVNRM